MINFQDAPFSTLSDEKLADKVKPLLLPTLALRLLGFLLVLLALFCAYLDWQKYAFLAGALGVFGSFCSWRANERELLREFVRRMSTLGKMPDAILGAANLSSLGELKNEWRKDANLYLGVIIALLVLFAVFLLLSFFLGGAS